MSEATTRHTYALHVTRTPCDEAVEAPGEVVSVVAEAVDCEIPGRVLQAIEDAHAECIENGDCPFVKEAKK